MLRKKKVKTVTFSNVNQKKKKRKTVNQKRMKTKSELKSGHENQNQMKMKSVGVRKTRVTILWILLLSSSGFGLYRNFTAINTHTVYNETIVESRIQNTSGIENFVIGFAEEFFTYGQESEEIDERTERLQQYMTDDLIRLNQHHISNDIENKSLVQNVFIWNVEQVDEEYFEVSFSIKQKITGEAELKREVESAYQVTVFVDENENMVVTRKSLSYLPTRAEHEPKEMNNDGSINSHTRHEAMEFLELFFSLYPTASAQELSFYIRDNVIPVVDREMTFTGLINPTFAIHEDNLIVDVSVEYLCKETLANITVSYRLQLEESNGNFIIVESF